MNVTTSTPCSSNPKKRVLPSPEDAADSKKNRFHSRSMSESDLESSAIMAHESKSGDLPLNNPPAQFTLDDVQLEKIASFMKNTFHPQIDDIVQQTLQKQVAELVNSIVTGVLEGLNVKVVALEKENVDLKKRVKYLEDSADQAEQYSRRNCLCISGLPEDDPASENTDDIVLKLAEAIHVDLSLNDIDRSHRLGKPDSQHNVNQKPRDIVVKFATYRSRAKFYKARVLTKDRGYKGVYINEHLTRRRNNLFYQARRLVKSKHLQSAWSFDGALFVKHFDDSIHRINSESDLP